MIRVAMLSFWHVHAWDYARQTIENPNTEIVAVWDEEPERGRAQANALGVPFYEALPDLLAQPDIDAVIVDTPTNIHRDVIVAAANAGKHIFTEKVLAPKLHECNEILTAVNQAGVKLTVSLPRLNDNYTLAIQDVLARTLLGELTLVRTRLSHNGAIGDAWLPAHFFNLQQCGGGALIDLGCHPMYLARVFLGLPDSVSASYGYITGREVEDNAVATLRYTNGALGIVEAGFVNRFSPFTIEIHGTEGSLLFGTPDDRLLVRSPQLEGGEKWVELPLPASKPGAFQQWVGHIQQGTTATENIEIAVDLTRLMEAANFSAQRNQPVSLNTLSH
jgi:predicted dehydrogenase